ncbi:MAG: WD40 repeat domain-containing protein [Saprospiraceae bacterium]|nr:WD40 repeat domain-containing protein [Saprospiraceae bacterium]
MAVLKVKKIAQLTGHNAAIFALTSGDTPQHFISGAGDGWVVRWNPEEPEIGRLIAKVDTQIFSLLNLSDYNIMIAGNMNGGLHWIHPENPEKTKNIAHHQKGVFDLIQAGEFVFTLGGEGKITRWSVLEERSLESLHVTNQSLRSIDFCSIRNEIAVGASDNNIYIMDVNTLEIKHIIHRAHTNSVFAVKYSPDGRYLLSGGRDAQLKAWDTANNFCKIFTQPAHWFTINHIAFHPDGQLFATASRDKTIKIWDASNFDLLKVIEVVRDKGHVNSVNRLLWTAPENYLISASDDRTMIVWKIE